MSRVVRGGPYHITTSSHFTTWWRIEVWEDGVQGPVAIFEQEKRPTYQDKRTILNVMLQRRKDAEEDKRIRDEERARHDAEELIRYKNV